MTYPSRAMALDQELTELRAQFRALAPEVQEGVLQSLRWSRARQDPKLMHVLTEARRILGAIQIESITPRRPESGS